MDIDKVLKVLEKRKSLHDNDPTIAVQWNALTELLAENVDETILLFESCTEEQILLFSEVFEDVAYKFQDVEFIKCLERVLEKYPNIPIGESVKTARQYVVIDFINIKT